MYHHVPIEQKCPPLARVLNEVASGRFGDGGAYEPYVSFGSFADFILKAMHWLRLLNTIRQNDYYLLTEDFDSCTHVCWHRVITVTKTTKTDIQALKLVDEAYQDRPEWIKKSIRTTAKVSILSSLHSL